MNEDRTVWCPNSDCEEGTLLKVCDKCGGEGRINGKICEDCQASGQLTAGTCPTCGGQGRVSEAYAKIYDADMHMHTVSPDWNGDDRGGVTVLSLAKWARFRQHDDELRQIIAVQGNIVKKEAIVLLLVNDRPAIVFHGFAWGYGGEGPTGLACVLCDAGFFKTLDEARSYVGKLPGDQQWALLRDQKTTTT